MLFANKSEDDILIKDYLEKYAETKKLKLYYTLDTVCIIIKISKYCISEYI